MQAGMEMRHFSGSTRTGSIIPFSGQQQQQRRLTSANAQVEVDVIPVAIEGEGGEERSL